MVWMCFGLLGAQRGEFVLLKSFGALNGSKSMFTPLPEVAKSVQKGWAQLPPQNRVVVLRAFGSLARRICCPKLLSGRQTGPEVCARRYQRRRNVCKKDRHSYLTNGVVVLWSFWAPSAASSFSSNDCGSLNGSKSILTPLPKVAKSEEKG
jgi:hypothetical protein